MMINTPGENPKSSEENPTPGEKEKEKEKEKVW